MRSLRKFLLLFLWVSFYSNASVIMFGTRIIYQDKLKEKIIQLQNPDNTPYVVQISIANGDVKNSAYQSDVPFIASPLIFRLEPQKRQIIRLMFTGSNTLPQNRESIFYFIFRQLPLVNAQTTIQHHHIVMLITNHIKLFYRPDGISDRPEDVAENLKFKIAGNNIMISNLSGYYASIRYASLLIDHHEYPLAETIMLPPKSCDEWDLPDGLINLAKKTKIRIKLDLINDYGADVISVKNLL